MDILSLWETTKNGLRADLGQTPFETWILPLRPRMNNANSLILEAPDSFFREWVEKNYKSAIQDAFNRHANRVVTVDIGVLSEPQAAAAAATETRTPINTPEFQPQNAAGLSARYTFENFIVGSSNRHAHAYCMAVAEAPAKTYNPLFIYGGVGLGKTHLMQATCHQILKKAGGNPKICYITSERFTNELIEAIQKHSTGAFRQKYRNVDVLVIDDIQFIAGKESTQEEFFHTFNALHDAHKQIIISSDRPPKEISNLQDRLVSRFSWGLTTDIQPPDLETRVAILKKKVEREPVAVPDDVLFFIAGLIKTNIRELEGALIRTIAYSLLEEKPITLDLAREVLRDLLKEPKKLITIDFIQRVVAEDFGVSLADLKTKRRNKNIVLPRQVAMYISRELTDLSFPEIGGFFGGKDHTTVLHSYNKIRLGVQENETLKNKIQHLIQIIQQ